MAVQLFSLAGMGCSTVGTSVLTLTTALPGHSSLASAGVTDGTEVRYLVKQGDDRELGTGTYSTGGVSISRDTVLMSIDGGTVGTSKLTLNGTAEVYLTVADVDLNELLDFAQAFTLPTSDGADGDILATNGAGGLEFVTPGGGGGGLVPISKTTASSDAAVDIDLSGGYSAYLIRLEDVVIASDGQALWMRVFTDGGTTVDSGGSDYGWSYNSLTTSAFHYDDNLDSKIIMAQSVGGSAGEAVSGNIWVYVSPNSRYSQIMYDIVYYSSSANIPSRSVGAAMRLSTTSITDVRFLTSSGNITSGDYHLYGIVEGA
jgi:hypothetical protein